jgi:hypothetical protein
MPPLPFRRSGAASHYHFRACCFRFGCFVRASVGPLFGVGFLCCFIFPCEFSFLSLLSGVGCPLPAFWRGWGVLCSSLIWRVCALWGLGNRCLGGVGGRCGSFWLGVRGSGCLIFLLVVGLGANCVAQLWVLVAVQPSGGRLTQTAASSGRSPIAARRPVTDRSAPSVAGGSISSAVGEVRAVRPVM